MRSYLKKFSVLAIAAAAAKAELVKRDPYWIKMADVIQQVRPDFYYGVATTKSFFANPKYNDIVSTYNLHTAGNECKFYTIQGTEQFNTKPCDESIEFAKKFGAKFRGHTLFWPAYSPTWFKSYSDDIEEVKAYYFDYLTKVLEHYKDEEDIIYWDVINEAVNDDSTSEKYSLRTGSSDSNEWKGWDTYTEDIFNFVREHTNPNVKLIYNDYNAENNNGLINRKTGAVYNYIKEMKEKGVPIDGVGLQMHIGCNYYPNYEQLTELINMYKEIGVEVHITEIDVSMEKCQTHDQQRKLYMDVFKACFDNENCKVFTVWGAYDTESWIGASNDPLPFDDDMYPKDIYFDMLEYVMNQLPEDATYPTPTVTKPEPQPTDTDSDLQNAKYVIKPGDYMVNAAWGDWSWGKKEDNSFDDDGNYQASFEEEQYGALSFHSNDKFNGGKIHLELKSDTEGAPIKVIVHTIKSEEFVTVETIESPSTEEMKAYDIDVPAVSGDNYNRISIQDAWGKAITITVANLYFVPSDVAPEKPDVTNGEKYSIVKEGDFMIDAKWQNWSWGVENSEFDDDGNMVNYITAGSWGGVSFKRGDGVTFGKGTFHFKAMVNDTNAQIQVLFHTTADENVNVGSVPAVSDSELTEFTLEIDEPTAEKYDRITIQDVANNGLILTLNDVYFISAPAESVDEPTTTEPVDEPTTTEPATEIKGTKYDIVKEGAVTSEWQNWSWGVDDSSVDENGAMANVLGAGNWAGISFKRSDSTLFGKFTLHLKAMSSDPNAIIQIVIHNTAEEDDSKTVGNFKNLSATELEEYTLEVDEEEKYDRITIQDIYNEGYTLSIDDVYIVVPEPEIEIKGTKYDIVKEGAVTSEWQNWSWGVDDSSVNENGAMANVLGAGNWAGVSFKRSDSTLFGKFTLHFKAMVTDPKAIIQVILHNSADEDDTVNAGSFKDLSDTEMKEYTLEVDAPANYDRITIQDIYNEGYTLIINDVYIVVPEPEVDDSCWASKLGFTCCKSTKVVIMEDADGAWGAEDGFWCGIVEDKEDTCWSTKLGYPCCKENNVIYSIDAQGSWGYENDSWCGITRGNEECEFNALGYSCCPDANVVFEDDHKWGYVNSQWCGVAF